MNELLPLILSHLRAIWRHRWYVVLVAWLVCAAGWVGVYLMPNKYEASARVYVDTQSVLKPLLSGLTVQPNLADQIGIMTRTLLSRPNLERVARMTDLDLKAKGAADMDKLIEGLAGEIKIQGVGRENLYTISYQHQSPDLAKRVVQSLLTIFVESSLGTKRADTDSALRFIDGQLKAYAEKLRVSEDALKEFKRKHLGTLPGQGVGNSYFERLQSAQKDAEQVRLLMRESEMRRDELKRRLLDEEPYLLGPEEPEVTTKAELPPAVDARVQALEKQLDQLRTRYTDLHPDIIGTKKLIEQLRQQAQEEAKLEAKKAAEKAKLEGATKNRRVASEAAASKNVVHQQLSVALAETEANIASLRARLTEFDKRYSELRAAADALPQVEAEYTTLNREYETNKKNYEQLLNRRETALMTGEMESKTDVVDFKVVDPPRVPARPSSPNRLLLYSAVLGAGLAAGIGLAFLMGQVRAAVDDRRSLRELTGLPVLGVVSMVSSVQDLKRRRRGLLAYLASFATLVGAYAAVMGVTWWLTVRT